jgi:hypothetical protein
MISVTRPICDLVKVGVEPVQAALTQGVDEPTFEEWLHKARQGGRGHESHIRFRQAVLQAEAECEAMLVTKLRSGNTGWQAALAMLERRFPERWLRRSIQAEDSMLNRKDGRPPAGGNPFEQLDNVVPLNHRPTR